MIRMNEQQVEYNKFMKKLVKNICEVQNEYNKLSPSVKDAVDLDMSNTIGICGITKAIEHLIKQYS